MKSSQSVFVLILGAIVIVLSLIKYMNFKLTLIQVLVFYTLSYDLDCKVYGGCSLSAWISLIVPLTLTAIFVLDYLKYFKKTKAKLIKIYKKFKLFLSSGIEDVLK